jgi:hypothetical protein
VAIPDELLDLLKRSGYSPHGEWFFGSERGEQWHFSSQGTARYVYFRTHAESPAELYSIYVEEWRGGEGYEDEEFRGNRSEALTQIPHWAAWASEPFVPQPSARERFFRRFGKRDPQSE